MDTDAFRQYLRRGGRTTKVAGRVIGHLERFIEFLELRGVALDAVNTDHIDSYVAQIESQPKTSAKTHLWALDYYFDFCQRPDLLEHAHNLRIARVKTQRRPFKLRDFAGVDPQAIAALAAAGINDVDQMRTAAATPAQRAGLAAQTGIAPATILELTKLSDLARIPGVKGIRARLYHDSGVDTLDKLAACAPADLCATLSDWVAHTGFDGIAPLPKEAEATVATAQSLPRLIQFDD